MKKSQLKQLLKPIIKECINEALIEQGLLSNIISEVVKGLYPLQTIVETKQQSFPQINQKEIEEIEIKRMEMLQEQQRALKEQKRKLLDAAGFQTNVFDGVEPLSKGGDVNESQDAQADPLSGIDPHDSGVDISGILALGGTKWSKMI
jgi:hypothetical protein